CMSMPQHPALSAKHLAPPPLLSQRAPPPRQPATWCDPIDYLAIDLPCGIACIRRWRNADAHAQGSPRPGMYQVGTSFLPTRAVGWPAATSYRRTDSANDIWPSRQSLTAPDLVDNLVRCFSPGHAPLNRSPHACLHEHECLGSYVEQIVAFGRSSKK